jgi:hypothetical protein
MGREETVPVCLGSNLSFVNYDIERGVVSVEKERFPADSALPERGAGKVEHRFSLAVTETPKYRGENVVIIFRRSGHSLKQYPSPSSQARIYSGWKTLQKLFKDEGARQ